MKLHTENNFSQNSQDKMKLHTEITKIDSMDKFLNSPWKEYYEIVYHEIPTTLPNLENLYIIYPDIYNQVFHSNLNVENYKECPKIENELYSVMSGRHDMPKTIWFYKKPPYKPLPGNTWVEVIHGNEPKETNGSWMYYTPGSGIYFYLGETRVYNDHNDAISC